MNHNQHPDYVERPANTISFRAILLVDDDAQLAAALQWILADQNFMVDVAYDGEEALLKVEANEYDAIVCDVKMPRLRGDEFYAKASERHPPLADRFIFITGYAGDPQFKEFIKATDCKFLVKPFPVNELIRCIKEMLA